MRRAVAIAGITILISALGSILAPAAGAKTTAPFQWTVKYTFGGPASKPLRPLPVRRGHGVGVRRCNKHL
jgi:hypothetical protein